MTTRLFATIGDSDNDEETSARDDAASSKRTVLFRRLRFWKKDEEKESENNNNSKNVVHNDTTTELLLEVDPSSSLSSNNDNDNDNDDVLLSSKESTTTTISTESSLNDVFEGDLSEFYANEIVDQINIPFIPKPIGSYILEQVFERMRSGTLTEGLLSRIEELIVMSKTTKSVDDQIRGRELVSLAQDIAAEISPNINLPFIVNEKRKQKIINRVCSRILYLMFTNQKEKKKAWVKWGITTRQEVLTSSESRADLVDRITAAIDIPFLNDSQEHKVFTTMMDRYAALLESLLPPGVVDTLTGADPDGVAHTKKYLIDTINEHTFHIPGLSEDRKRHILKTMVDIYLDEYVFDVSSRLALMTPTERQEELVEKCGVLERKLVFSTRRYEREQQSLETKLEKYQTMLSAMDEN